MSKLILWNILSLDGFFEGIGSWTLDWHQPFLDEDFDRFSLEQLHAAEMLLFGRITYEGMAAYWQPAQGEKAELMNRLSKAVVSRTLDRGDWQNTTLLKGDLATEISRLKQHVGKDIFVFGSANLCSSLREHDLVDEYRFCIDPVILGCGRPFFERDLGRLRLRLLEARSLSSGSTILRYEPIRSEARNGA